jgi:hypothetical protein
VGALEAEFNSIPALLQEETKAMNGELLSWLQSVLSEGRAAGVFEFSGDPADKAALVLSSLQGGLHMARALGTQKFYAVVEQNNKICWCSLFPVSARRQAANDTTL